MIYRLSILFFLFTSVQPLEKDPFIVILGTVQDAGFPQIGCDKGCCEKYRDKKIAKQKVSCLALFDPSTNQKWIFDATPDLPEQLQETDKLQKGDLSGIFLTHAHFGHYTGLMYLGREALNAKEIPVYTMPRMYDYLKNNGPWSQLVSLKNIQLQKLKADSTIMLTDEILVTPFLVPHRDEFSETIGYGINVGIKSVLFIPDIDKWQKWNIDISELVTAYDYVFLDGTFYKDGELPGRNMSEVPHPFIQESVDLFSSLPLVEKQKIWFIHFNHTNPLLDKTSKEYKEVKSKGFNVAVEGLKISL
ncbi:MAG TPA: MBL fold metallo-hydrolase [Chitinophagaceae bacterium]|nr:MBL fold metallo-hydrolase [Chitinophagaceae bacterium]